MKPRWFLLCVAFFVVARAAIANDAVQAPDLPPLAQATRALMTHPLVLAARARVDVEDANRARLRAGPYEFGVRAGGAQRRAERDQLYNEWDVLLERPLRLPRKARLDATLGDQGVDVARIGVNDALHEAGRALLRSWFGWVRERAQVRQWALQSEVLRESLAVTQKRLRAGDASQLELNLVEAALAQTNAAAAQARARDAAAASELTRQFPGIALPATPNVLAPRALTEDEGFWITRILEESHELAVARAESLRQRTVASRADADRIPDPAVGARIASERGGAERIGGVFFSIPLPGEGRRAAACGAIAQAEVAAQREAIVQRRVSADAASALARATGSFAAWQSASDAADRMRRNAQLTARGYELGETPIVEVLLARRMAIEAQLNALAVQADATEARYRVLLDAHEL